MQVKICGNVVERPAEIHYLETDDYGKGVYPYPRPVLEDDEILVEVIGDIPYIFQLPQT